jgi:xanthine dehydrogenase accessory factor
MSAPDPSVLAKALAWLLQGRRIALATVIRTWGSAPQPAGGLLLIDADAISWARSRGDASRRR